MKVELVAKTKGVNKYENFTSEDIIAAIARHGKIKENGNSLVIYLLEKKHWLPLDMINFNFEIHTSRAMGRHIIRHDMKFQETSQRYESRVKFEEIELRKKAGKNRQSSIDVINDVSLENKINKHLIETEKLYFELINANIARECARMILPECTSTIINANATLRGWLSFLNVRCDHHSQKEVRMVADLIGKELEKDMPNVFEKINWQKGFFM